ncbi:c-type cytochrome [Piscinibacter sp. XHJ-5]|uniref:cytochrome c oxidase subunit II n=1 Tax=Piscinibacter sp. XHJ-5 TaxID=3037797 RepID=UPI0024534716|nr:c-type cytochrome [Piscinibacter sp. XHJ-5]
MSAASVVEPPSVLSPAGVQADALAEVSWVLIVGASVIFVLTMALVAASFARRKPAIPTAWWVLGGGIALPVVVLSALLLYSTWRTRGLDEAPVDAPLVIAVTGHLWWWEVHYRDPVSGREIALANELRLPVGRAARLALTSADVIHSVWVPTLGGKMDLVPGRTNRLMITASRAGVQRGECAEFCGEQHSRMALHVIALPPAEFDAWLAREARPAAAPRDAAQERGRRAFLDGGCAACHPLRGVSESGIGGPDLTHVGGRLFLGAGVLRNDAGALARWIADVQQLKPGARMPSFGHLDAPTRAALADYLGQLQ